MDPRAQLRYERAVRIVPADVAAIAEAAELLRAGSIVAFPTETVYGLGARALDREAILRIFRAKGRPSTHPLIVHVRGEEEAREMTVGWDERASRLARAYWPGPLTLVLARAPHVPSEVAGGGTLAVRAPSHPVARRLLEALGEPIAAPSANRYQTLSPTRAEHVARSLGAEVDLILDGGPCATGIESTVLDLTAFPPRLLRPGSVTLQDLRSVVGDVTLTSGTADVSEPRRSPGMDAKHYAPRAPLRLVSKRDLDRAVAQFAERARLAAIYIEHVSSPCWVEESALLRVELPADATLYARDLFAALHRIDDWEPDEILVQDPGDSIEWHAVRDRLIRASASA